MKSSDHPQFPRCRPNRRLIITAAAIGSVTAFASAAQAIPAFARKYETGCITCHVAPPKLNAFGRAFRNRGYRMPRLDEDLIRQKQVSLGAPGWKRVWPRGVWPASIPGGNYFAMDFHSSFTVSPDSPVTN